MSTKQNERLAAQLESLLKARDAYNARVEKLAGAMPEGWAEHVRALAAPDPGRAGRLAWEMRTYHSPMAARVGELQEHYYAYPNPDTARVLADLGYPVRGEGE